MEDNLEKLKEIGAQQIHKDTHISKDYVQAIIHGSFDGMTSVQLMGFISILEREYQVDLSDLKQKARTHYKDLKAKISQPQKVFVGERKKQDNSKVYLLLVAVVFIAAAYYNFVYMDSAPSSVTKVDNSLIENVQKNIEVQEKEQIVENVEETNETLQEDENISNQLIAEAQSMQMQQEEESESEIAVQEEVVETKRSLKILPKNKIWAGYINIETNQKYQQIFRDEFAIDTKSDWLLLFGSGTVHLEINGENKTFSSDQNMRFKYVDGEFTKITVTEFKALNKGRKW
jgi:hypothetical protein